MRLKTGTIRFVDKSDTHCPSYSIYQTCLALSLLKYALWYHLFACRYLSVDSPLIRAYGFEGTYYDVKSSTMKHGANSCFFFIPKVKFSCLPIMNLVISTTKSSLSLVALIYPILLWLFPVYFAQYSFVFSILYLFTCCFQFLIYFGFIFGKITASLFWFNFKTVQLGACTYNPFIGTDLSQCV